MQRRLDGEPVTCPSEPNPWSVIYMLRNHLFTPRSYSNGEKTQSLPQFCLGSTRQIFFKAPATVLEKRCNQLQDSEQTRIMISGNAPSRGRVSCIYEAVTSGCIRQSVCVCLKSREGNDNLLPPQLKQHAAPLLSYTETSPQRTARLYS